MQDVKGPDIPLMPIVLKVHFINSSSKEGIANLRKSLYKVHTQVGWWVGGWGHENTPEGWG